MKSRGEPLLILRGGLPLGTISMDQTVCQRSCHKSWAPLLTVQESDRKVKNILDLSNIANFPEVGPPCKQMFSRGGSPFQAP